MIKVKYFGICVMVPNWANFIAMDADGVVCVFENEPTAVQDAGAWLNKNNIGKCEEVHICGNGWSGSLKRIDK